MHRFAMLYPIRYQLGSKPTGEIKEQITALRLLTAMVSPVDQTELFFSLNEAGAQYARVLDFDQAKWGGRVITD